MTASMIATETLDDHLLRLLALVTPDRIRDGAMGITLTAGPGTARDHDVTRQVRHLGDLGLVERDGNAWSRTAAGDACIAKHGRHVINATSGPLPAEYLAAIQARVDAANSLPWALVPRECPEHGPHFDLHGGAVSDNPADWWLNEIVSHNGGPDCADGYPLTEGNAEFLMHAREDVPALLTEIKRLRDALAEQKQISAILDDYAMGYKP